MPFLHRAIAVTDAGKTPLMDAVIKGDIDKVKSSLGANVDEQDEAGWTALQLAAAYDRLEIVGLLLANGACPNISNSVGRTALMYAAALGHTSIVRALLAGGADSNVVSHDPEDASAEEDGWTLAGETALMLASWSGHTEIIRLLIEAGADVNAKGGPVGGTALHSALWEGFASSIHALLEAPNIDLNQTDSSGLTAKEAARKMGREEIALTIEEAESERMVSA